MVDSCYYPVLVLATLLTASAASICLVTPATLPATVLQSQGNLSATCGVGVPQAVQSLIGDQVRQKILAYLQECRLQATPSAVVASTVVPSAPTPTVLAPASPATTTTDPLHTTPGQLPTATPGASQSQEEGSNAATSVPAEETLASTAVLPVATSTTASSAPLTTAPLQLATSEALKPASVAITPTSTLRETLFPTATPAGSSLSLPRSCLDLAIEDPSADSGEYWIQPDISEPAEVVYCEMNHNVCCNTTNTAGWMRAAYLNTNETESSTTCPGNWTLFRTAAEYACGRDRSVGGCSSAIFPVYGVEYTRVCGRINAYEHELPNGFTGNSRESNIDLPYLDGISVTNGELERQHIWSFAGQYYAVGREPIPEIVAIVGDDFFCDNPDEGSFDGGANIVEDPLWDGVDCSANNPSCCTAAPWFCKELNEPAMSDIEVRICGDTDDEDTPIFLMEIYVQ